MSYVFDASSILVLTRELQEKVVGILKGNLTLSLAHYEIGNALWKECNRVKRLTVNEAVEVLGFTLALLNLMNILDVKDAYFSTKALSNADKLNITYYDAAYLTAAQVANKTLVSDDGNLVAASRKIGVKTMPSKALEK